VSGPTLESLEVEVNGIKEDVADLKTDNRFLMRLAWFASGAIFMLGAATALIIPKIVKLLGL